jgi:hypothetical protein
MVKEAHMWIIARAALWGGLALAIILALTLIGLWFYYRPTVEWAL